MPDLLNGLLRGYKDGASDQEIMSLEVIAVGGHKKPINVGECQQKIAP